MKRIAAFSLVILAVAAGGCGKCEKCHPRDTRTLNDRLRTPDPDFGSRPVAASPADGAPTRPYRISETKSYYKSTGGAPHFPHHDEVFWTIDHKGSPEFQKLKAEETAAAPQTGK